jgi:hypothetical protein
MDKRCVLVVGSYALIAWGLAWATGYESRFSLVVYFPIIATATWIGLICLSLGLLIKVGFVERPPRLLPEFSRRFRQDWLIRPRLIQAVGSFLLLSVTLSTYTSVKSLIPEWTVYDWDPFWISVDRNLHGGTDPWRFTHWLLGTAYLTRLMDFFYGLWFFIMFAVLFWQSISLQRPELRKRFFLAFYLCWVINGSLLAFAFASGGPCFYDRFVDGPNPYQPLMQRLEQCDEICPLWALPTQQRLGTNYDQHELVFGSGISAMPSMHIVVAFLLFLFARHHGRWWGIGFFFIFLLTVLGSVHLSWHYAVDSYVAIAVTSLIWWMTGRSWRTWFSRLRPRNRTKVEESDLISI